MKRCKTCKYWNPKFRNCKRGTSERGRSLDRETLAFAADEYASYKTYLYTEPEFGCVMYKEKPHVVNS